MKLATALAIAGSLAAVIPSGAATISYSGTTLVLSGAGGTTSVPGSLTLFDPAIGTLTGVAFEVSDFTIATLRYENLTSVPPAAGSAETVVSVLFDGATTLASAIVSGSHSGGASTPFDGGLDFLGTSGFTSNPIAFGGTGIGVGLPASYIGVGSFPVTIQRTASQIPLSAPGGFVVTNNSADSRVDYKVTYTYTAIPEPASASFAGLAVAALLMRRRRN